MTTSSAAYLTELHQLLNQHFNLAEIEDLCLRLHIDYESVPGDEKPSRIRALLLGLGRHGRLPDLIALAQKLRPRVDWPPLPDGFELPESLAGETAVPTNQYHIYDDNIQGDKFTGDKIGRDKNIVGDISGPAVVAVGGRAQATINQYGDIIIHADNFEDLPPAPGDPPYKGLAYFTTKDKALFFGREKLSDELADRLQTTRFLAIMGASGSGKSSLLRAGIIPRLEERNWRIHIIKPGAHPLSALAASLTRDDLDPAATDIIGKALATNADTLHKTAEKLVARTHAERLLLAVDQFEELFTQCKDPQEQQTFVDNLVSAAQTQGAVTVLLSMRADFYGRVSHFHNLPDLISQQQVYIKPMAEEDLVRAIAEPAKRGGWKFVEGLVEQFVADVGKEPGRLPLLSHALLATWERRRGVTLTLGGYIDAGGVKSAIAQTAEATYATLTASEQVIAKRIFLRLTELGKGTEDTRRRVNQAELGEDTAVQAVTQRLIAARLITTTQDGIDVAHEALIREWPRLRGWLDADREGLIIHRRLTDAEREWRNNGHEPSLLYSGFRLNEAEQWVKDNANVLNNLEQTFFTTSIAERQKREEEEEAQRQRELKQAQALAAEQQQRAEEQTAAAKRLRSRNMLFAGAAIVAFTLAVVAFIFFGNAQSSSKEAEDNLAQATRALIAEETAQADSAENLALAQTREADAEENLELANIAQKEANANLTIAQTRESEAIAANATAEAERNVAQEQAAIAQSRSLATSALTLGHENDMRALLLAIAAGQQADTTLAFTALYTQLPLMSPPRPSPLSHEDWVKGATWNADGSWILTWYSDKNTVTLWDTASGERLQTFSHDNSVSGVTWNADESQILIWGRDVAILWDTASGERLQTFSYEGWASGATWNVDESQILTWGGDVAILWDIANGEQLQTLSHEDYVLGAEWNADESQILTWGGDYTAVLWDTASGERLRTLSHDNWVRGAAWNADGDQILTWSDDNTVGLWNVASGERLQTISYEGSPTGFIGGATWNADESQILIWGGDVAILLDITNGEQLQVLPHEDSVYGAAWSADESQILTWSHDGTAVVWATESGKRLQVLPHGGSVSGAMWNADESQILTWGHGSAVLWTTESGKRLQVLSHEGVIEGAAWNSDERQILTWSQDGETKLWNAASRERLQTFFHDSWVNGVAWNEDESQILTWSEDGTAVLWNTASEERLQTLSHEGPVEGAVWNKDESQILTWSHDGTAVLWATVSGERLQTLSHRSPVVEGAAWNRDESQILTWSRDSTAVVWETASGKQLQTLLHERGVKGAAWNSDESQILTWGNTVNSSESYNHNKTAILWDAASGKQLQTLSHGDSVYGAAWNSDESQILTWSRDSTAVVWEAASGEQLQTFAYDNRVYGATWNGDESRVLTWSSDGTVVVWDAASGERLQSFAHDVWVNGAAWNGDESQILTWSEDGTAVLWNTASEERLQTLSHEGPVEGAVWNKDESQILTWSHDGAAKIWDAQTGLPLRIIAPDGTPITDAQWNHNEDQLLVATEGGLVRIYYTNMDELLNIACQSATRNFNWDEWQLYFPVEPYRQTCPNFSPHPSVP